MAKYYKFLNPEGLYFVSFAVVYWLDVFANNTYKDLFLDSVRYCQKHKNMEIIAWCIMTNHIHLIFQTIDHKPENVLGDLKRFTSRTIVKAIQDNPTESRKGFWLAKFKKAASESSNVKHHQFWRHDNHPVELWSNKVITQKIHYIHQNPVKAGFVTNSEDYLYSSALDYAGKQGILEDVVVAGL